MQDIGARRKKLIETTIPLERINRAASTEKSIRHGHPSTLHLWWARRPLACCRAVLIASLIDDPSEHSELYPTVREQEARREYLMDLIADFADWKNIHDANLYTKIQAEIARSTGDTPPSVLDPFSGGGSIPLEAQRLGLEPHASDLNPVAVLINKAQIEIPPRFANCPPVSQQHLFASGSSDWKGARGLATDIRHYGQWVRNEAEKRIGKFYPKARLADGNEATVIAWIWARTVKCPNPTCGTQMPLVRSFWLSKKKSKETWAAPTVDQRITPPTISYAIQHGPGVPLPGTVNRNGATCLACGTPVPFDYVRKEGRAGRMGQHLMAIVAEGKKGRVYLAPSDEQAEMAKQAVPTSDMPETDLPENALGFRIQNYGMTRHRDLFTSRQLLALTTFSDLVREARARVLADAAAGLPADERTLSQGGCGAAAYADAVAVYLALGVDKATDYWSAITTWNVLRDGIRSTFARQAISMVWDFAEVNCFSDSTGNYMSGIDWIVQVIENIPCERHGEACQRDATASINGMSTPLISTDPPYYDNIGYADLSDFFYVWLRRSLREVYPDLFRTMLVPKAEELVATPYRFENNKEKAKEFFEKGLHQAFERMRKKQHPDYPLTVYYAFKQAENESEGSILVPVSWTGP